jgi:hypothetical protein
MLVWPQKIIYSYDILKATNPVILFQLTYIDIIHVQGLAKRPNLELC